MLQNVALKHLSKSRLTVMGCIVALLAVCITTVSAQTATVIDFGLGPNYLNCADPIKKSSLVESVYTADSNFQTLHDGCQLLFGKPLVELIQTIGLRRVDSAS